MAVTRHDIGADVVGQRMTLDEALPGFELTVSEPFSSLVLD